MILKNFVGKTLEAAQKSARQMLGDDFIVLESKSQAGKRNAQITVMSDDKKEAESPIQNKKTSANGVQFARSKNSKKNTRRLKSLRRYAKKQDATLEDSEKEEKTSFTPRNSTGKNVGQTENFYSRANIRSPKKNIEKQKNKAGKKAEESNQKETSFLSQLSQMQAETNQSASSNRKQQREMTALHKRFDKLEALLDSSMISANLDYVSHPAFQQLVRIGISTSVVARWFGTIVKDRIDPFDQPTVFMTKLSGLIREAIGNTVADEAQKFILFTGPAGTGKTHLIMKLTQHPAFMADKKTAVVSILPRGEKSDFYYTVLEPFCKDHEIPYFQIKSGVEVTKNLKKWKPFDHVLIDSPSISIHKEDGFREYWETRQLLASITPLEVHYVINAALSQYYFQRSSAAHHPLQPDYIAITHLDEVTQWGPIIPFLKEMDCGVRYTSTGNTVPESLDEFNPKWFAQKLLQEN